MRDHRINLYLWSAAGSVLCVGILALVCDHLEVRQSAVVNLHLVFGLGLAVTVAAALIARRCELDQLGGEEFYQYTRRISRWVYLLVYVLALVRVTLQLLDTPHGGLTRVGSSPRLTVPSMADFQIYVVYAIVPLWIVRSLMLAVPAATWAAWTSRSTSPAERGRFPSTAG